MVHVKIKFFTYINKSLNFIHIGKTIAASAIVFLLCGYFPIDFSLIALNSDPAFHPGNVVSLLN